MTPASHAPSSWTDVIEETLISALLGMMTLLTFANVVARYVFNSNILWALELTVFMFGWLVLLGASYAVKKGLHLGVDVVLNLLSPSARRIMALVAVACCIVFSLLLLKGAWDYWANFANLPQTTGRIFPTGFEENFRGRGWYETQDVPVPFDWLNHWLSSIFNRIDETEYELYEKIPRVIPYFVMPVSMALLVYRFVQSAVKVWRGDIDRIVASHEAEDDIAEAAAKVEEAK